MTRKKRTVRETLLVVAEGDAEVAFVRYLKSTYLESLGRSVQTTNAHGKGGRHVLDVASRRANNRDHDKAILLLDTDTNWTEVERERAHRSRMGRRGRLDVIESTPCLEAWLLEILGRPRPQNTKQAKKAFKDWMGCEVHEPGWMKKHLSRELLDEARGTVKPLAELMNHMGIPKP